MSSNRAKIGIAINKATRRRSGTYGQGLDISWLWAGLLGNSPRKVLNSFRPQSWVPSLLDAIIGNYQVV